MTIEFQFTLDDYRNAFRAHIKKGASGFTRWLMRFSLAGGVFFLLVGILFLVTGQRAPNVMLPPLLIGIFWIWIGMGGTYSFAAKRQFAKNPALRQPRRVEINDAGVQTDAGVASSQQPAELASVCPLCGIKGHLSALHFAGVLQHRSQAGVAARTGERTA